MSDHKLTKNEKIYNEKYGDLPNTQEEILEYIINNLNPNMDKIREMEEGVNKIGWNELSFILYLIPKPCPRPRYSFKTKHFYVLNASENKQMFKRHVNNQKIIFTRTVIDIKAYMPTPRSMNRQEIYLAEKNVIEPISNPDWDNLAKTYCDMIQDIILLNDNIISIGKLEKHYSLKPRVEINIRYQDNFDCNYNQRKIVTSKAYIDLMSAK